MFIQKNNYINSLFNHCTQTQKNNIRKAVKAVCDAKIRGGKIVVVTGSGPNIHEGVTTLIAELINKNIVDGVTTSAAVVAHEMGGALEYVKRINANLIKDCISGVELPLGDFFEYTLLSDKDKEIFEKEMYLDQTLLSRLENVDGSVIIKAAANMAYPLGLRNEMLAYDIYKYSKLYGYSFEYVAGFISDERTMIGAAARKGIPLWVSVPQLIGGGAVGLCISDSIPISQRSMRIAQMLQSADVIIESAVALTQEIHDGPFETYTGHGIWANWQGQFTYSLKNKPIIRIDMDQNLERAWEIQKNSGIIQESINSGLPKTKLTKIPFRMEMSAFSRLPDSLPIIGDIGVVWPIIAQKVSEELGIDLEFMSYPQDSEQGKLMRDYIANNIKYADRKRLCDL